MNKIPTLAVMTCALFWMGALPASAFTPPESDFSIAFAADPTIEVQTPRTRDDPGHRNYRLRDGDRIFEVTVDQYPASIPVPPPDQESYLLLLSAHARQTGWRLAATEKAEVSGAPALQGRFEGEGGRVELMRVMMVGHDIYQVRAVAPSAADLSSAVEFVNSFTVKLRASRR
jgi:hypothetical protein